MYRRVALLVLTLMSVASLADVASAIPRWRRGRRNTQYYSYSSGWYQVASKRDEASAGYDPLAAYCSYQRANAEEVAFDDRLRIFLEVWDKRVLDVADDLVAEVKITELSAAQTVHTRHVPIELSDVTDEEYKLATFDIANEVEQDPLIHPSKVYRVFINLHRKADEYGTESAIGRLPGPYYVATSGPSVLEQARQRIVMRTFREWYYTERGWNRNAAYPMDCHAYYRWATGSCTVGSTNGWANLGHMFPSGYKGGGNIPDLMKEGPIHGDYVRKPGHTFMLLSYDAEQGHVWTMEANFNHTIEVVQRQIGSGWTVGHLASEAIDHELFHVSTESTEQEESDVMPASEPEESDEMMARNASVSETSETTVQ